MEPTEQVPRWLLRPLPANAVVDQKVAAQIDQEAAKLPSSIYQLHYLLSNLNAFCEYDAAANRAAAHVWLVLDRFQHGALRQALFSFARDHMVERAMLRICRRLVKDADVSVRSYPLKLVNRGELREVALPLKPDGPWDASGWLQGLGKAPLARHKQGTKVLEQNGLPVISKLSQLRGLLGILSTKQLGWLLLASAKNNGPYVAFDIPKRDGGQRPISAPKWQLRLVQRRILDRILSVVPAHAAAHGFVPGRSTVTNAAAHVGARVILKFDLADFFPTIHYYRVMGLFARLGYTVDDARFGTEDQSTQVAPTLARLCCYTPDPFGWGTARLPQGAPTSPAISNLVCRRLDARLHGLARRHLGTYTRYADDLTFSFKNDVKSVGRFRWWVDQICHQEGFFVHQAKFRVIRSAQRQVVTGIVVNDKLRVPREVRRRLRAILHNCRKQGVAAQERGRPHFLDYLRGLASYIHMIHPEEGADFLRQVDELALGPEDEA